MARTSLRAGLLQLLLLGCPASFASAAGRGLVSDAPNTANNTSSFTDMWPKVGGLLWPVVLEPTSSVVKK
jgi:hypothetical protein